MSRQKYNKEIVCPYCDHRHEDSYDYFSYRSHSGDVREIECSNCEKEFEVTIHISWEYSSTINNCKFHSLELRYDLDSFILFECTNCFEEFYDNHLPSGRYPKMKDGEFEFVGKAKELMNKEKSEDDKR